MIGATPLTPTMTLTVRRIRTTCTLMTGTPLLMTGILTTLLQVVRGPTDHLLTIIGMTHIMTVSEASATSNRTETTYDRRGLGQLTRADDPRLVTGHLPIATTATRTCVTTCTAVLLHPTTTTTAVLRPGRQATLPRLTATASTLPDHTLKESTRRPLARATSLTLPIAKVITHTLPVNSTTPTHRETEKRLAMVLRVVLQREEPLALHRDRILASVQLNHGQLMRELQHRNECHPGRPILKPLLPMRASHQADRHTALHPAFGKNHAPLVVPPRLAVWL